MAWLARRTISTLLGHASLAVVVTGAAGCFQHTFNNGRDGEPGDVVEAATDAMVGDGPMDATPDAIDTNDAQQDSSMVPSALVFVISSLTIDPTPMVGGHNQVNGLNVDGFFSVPSDPDNTGCNKQDWFPVWQADVDTECSAMPLHDMCPSGPCSLMDSMCAPGIDDQLPALADLLTSDGVQLRGAITQAVTMSQFVILVRVTGITDLMNSPMVQVSLFPGYPDFNSGCTSVQPGRMYQVDARSLIDPTNLDTAKSTYQGSIVNGRLEIGFRGPVGVVPPFLFSVPMGGWTMSFPLEGVQLRGDIISGGLANGVLAGYANESDLISTLSQDPIITTSTCMSLAPSINGLVDINIMGLCGDPTASCPPPANLQGGLSMGFGMSAVPAIIDPVHPSIVGPITGTCGH